MLYVLSRTSCFHCQEGLHHQPSKGLVHFLHFVNDKCTELCDIIQSNVTRVYQELSSPVKQKKATGVKSKSTFKRKLSNVLKYFRNFAFAMYLLTTCMFSENINQK